MSTTATPRAEEVDRVILKVLKDNEPEMTTANVVSRVLEHNQRFNEVDVKRAVWRMIAAQQLQLSPDQLLLVYKSHSKKHRR